MPFEGFIHPALVFGSFLAAVPLLIHLLNRQRHRPLPWAAMQFALAAYRRTRRRAQLENLLLLLLRMSALVFLSLALARPFTGGDSPLAPLTESRRDMILVLDASASTAYREGVESVYETGLARAREILGELDATRGDRVHLIHAGALPRELSSRSPDEALAMLGTLSAPTEEALDLAETMALVASIAEKQELSASTAGSLEIRVLSDLQRHSWSMSAAAAAESREPGSHPLWSALERLRASSARVVVEDLGTGNGALPPNIGIEEVAPVEAVLGAGLQTEICVSVRNYGAEGRGAVRVALEVDGERLPIRHVDLPARNSERVLFPVLFRESGHHRIEAILEGDRLALDDRRCAIVHVPRPTRLLLVNGDPQDEVDRDEVGLWRSALDPPDDGTLGRLSGSYAPFLTRTVNALTFEGTELDEADVIVLANVGPVSPRTVERLEERVAAGASLILTMGDSLRARAALEGFNARFWRADGTGLLAARLRRCVEVASRRDSYWRVESFDEEHPVLRFFADERWRPLLTEIPIYAFVASDPSPDARVLARLDDADSSPLLVERDYDNGRVFLWTTTIDADWNRIPESHGTMIPLAHELTRYAGVRDGAGRNVGVGGVLSAVLDSFPRKAMLIRPDGSSTPLDGEPEALNEGSWRLPSFADTDRSGTWRIELEGQPDLLFAVQLDPREGDLQRMSAAELEAEHPVWSCFDPESALAMDEENAQRRGELWRFFAGLTLAVLVLETLWAAWIGRGRRMA